MLRAAQFRAFAGRQHLSAVAAVFLTLTLAACGGGGGGGNGGNNGGNGSPDGGGPECPNSARVCDNACVDTKTNRDHCGGCDEACAPGELCADGDCVENCPDGTTRCSGGCVDRMSSDLHCGACDSPCLDDTRCIAGRCSLGCPDQCPEGWRCSRDEGACVPRESGPFRLDLDLAPRVDMPLPDEVVVSGRLTLNDNTVPDHPRGIDRGEIHFLRHVELPIDLPDGVDLPPVRVAGFEIDDRGEVDYSVEVPPGEYTIAVSGSGDLDGELGIPPGSHTLREDISIRGDAVLDLNLRVATISGRVTRNGATMPDDDRGDDRGRVHFIKEDGTVVDAGDFGSRGEAQYRAVLAAGRYDVVVVGEGGFEENDVLPPQNYLAREGLDISSDALLDIDVLVSLLNVGLSLNGAPLPDHPFRNNRGRLEFRNESTGSPNIGLDEAGPFERRILLMAGLYDVYLTGEGELLPAMTTLLRKELNVSGDSAIDLPARTARMAGRVTRDMDQIPDDPRGRSRGTLQLVATDAEDNNVEGAVLMTDLEARGDVQYEALVFPGRYDVVFDGNSSNQLDDDAPLPGQSVKLRNDVNLTGDGFLDINIVTARMTGVVTRDGFAVPDDNRNRGLLSIMPSNGEGQAYPIHDFGERGEIRFNRLVLAGIYDLTVRGGDGSGVQREDAALPAQAVTVLEGVQIVGPTAVDIDLPTALLSGRVTLNLGSIPDSDVDRGTVTFVDADSGAPAAAIPLERDGDVTYQIRLMASTYDIFFAGNPDGFRDGSPVPGQSAPLRQGLNLNGGEAVLDIDIPTSTIVGRITLGGQQIPDSPDGEPRGTLSVLRSGTESGWVVFDLEDRGAVTYEAQVVNGVYDIVYSPGPPTDIPLPAAPAVLWESVAFR